MSAYERGARRTAAQSVLPAPPADGRQPLPEMNATTNSCLWSMPQLRCQRLVAGDNNSRLVCAASDGQEGASDMYAALVSLSALIVPAAVLLNLAVVVTVYMNRRLHTVINVLVTVLCMNNVMWTGMPILCVFAVNFAIPWQCTLRSFFFLSTRHICFSVIVIITVLRYLLVVKNRSFPADRRSSIIFIVFAVGPSLLKFYLRGFRDHSKSRKPLAWSPDGYAIIGLFKEPVNWVSATVISIEYMSGLLVIAICYVRILIKIFQSKRRLRKRRAAAVARWGRRAPISVASRRSQPEGSQEGSGARDTAGQQRAITSLENVMRMIRHYSAAKSVAPLPAEPCSSRSGTQAARSSGQPTEHGEPAGRLLQPAASSHSAGSRAAESASSRASDPEAAAAPQPVPAMVLMEAQPPSAGTERDGDHDSAAAARASSSVSRVKPPHTGQGRSTSTATDRGIDHITSGNLILRPSNLLKVETSRSTPGSSRSASGESASSACAQASRPAPRRPAANQAAARVDIVATVSMTAFIMIFFVVISPLWTLGLVNDTSDCVILPTMRIFLYIILIATGGSAAIVSPLVLVLFSGDFRRALRDTMDRIMAH